MQLNKMNSTPVSKKLTSSRTIQCLGWYLFWFTIILVLYWPGIIILPKRDHPIFMLGRTLAASDLDWFVDVLSYNRTRLLDPGDYYGFRPLHMALLATYDLLFRTRFVMQGVVCCALFAWASTSFFGMFRRLAGLLPALALIALWIAQLAGVEIVIWQHINPYLLAPTLLCLALTLVSGETWTASRAFVAGVAVLGACLTHEISVLISLALAVIAFLSSGPSPDLRRRIITTFLPAALLALSMNAIDYIFIHPPPSLIGPADIPVNKMSFFGSLVKLVPLAGAIGLALLFPAGVRVRQSEEFTPLWNFLDNPHPVIVFFAIVTVILVGVKVVLVGRRHAREGMTERNLAGLFFILLFGTVFSVSVMRTVTRGIDYMFGAGYYFSLTSLALCGILALFIGKLGKTQRIICCVMLLGLAFWHGYGLRTELLTTAAAKEDLAESILSTRSVLVQDPSLCFKGMDISKVPPELANLTPLYQDVSCTVRKDAQPLYLSIDNGFDFKRIMVERLPEEYMDVPLPGSGNVKQASIRSHDIQSPKFPYGYPLEFTVDSRWPFRIVLEVDDQVAYGFTMEYNTVIVGQSVMNTLTWNLSARPVSYHLCYNANRLLLFADDQLISYFPINAGKAAASCRIIFQTKGSDQPLVLSRFRIAKKPSICDVNFIQPMNLTVR